MRCARVVGRIGPLRRAASHSHRVASGRSASTRTVWSQWTLLSGNSSPQQVAAQASQLRKWLCMQTVSMPRSHGSLALWKSPDHLILLILAPLARSAMMSHLRSFGIRRVDQPMVASMQFASSAGHIGWSQIWTHAARNGTLQLVVLPQTAH